MTADEYELSKQLNETGQTTILKKTISSSLEDYLKNKTGKPS
jgi:hypothetical protein